MSPSQPSSEDAVLQVRVIPRSRVSCVAGLHGDAIKIRLRAPPVDGKANAELIRFLAERLNLPRGAVSIEQGATGRTKRVRIVGCTDATARAALLS